MSGGADRPRFVAAAERAAIPTTASVELIDPIDRSRHTLTGADWLDHVRSLKRTAVNADAAVVDAVRDELARSTVPILVLTDHTLPVTNDRLSVIGPPATVRDAGIVAIAARAQPAAQVMVTVRTHRQTAGPATLTVTSGPATARRRLDLPAAGDVTTFIDLPTLAEVVEARLSPAADDLPANDIAWLVRSGESPRIEVRSPAVPEPVRRFADVYARSRPPSERAAPVAIAADQADLSGDAGAVVPPSSTAAPSGDVHVTVDPLTRVVDWKRALTDAAVAPNPPRGEGWLTVISIADRPVVARRDTPARQVWVGFDQAPWSKSPDFVVFWANALDWLTGPAVRWTSDPATVLAPQWKPITPIPDHAEPRAWPGVYRDDQGRTLAMNAAPVEFDKLRGTEPANVRLASGEARTWSRELLLAAMLCVCIAALTWRGS
jgi:hypothetical protein